MNLKKQNDWISPVIFSIVIVKKYYLRELCSAFSGNIQISIYNRYLFLMINERIKYYSLISQLTSSAVEDDVYTPSFPFI